MTRYGFRFICRWTVLGILVCSLLSCSAFKPKVEPLNANSKAPSRKAELPRVNYNGTLCYLHEVRWPEESLAVIARWYTGRGENARILAKVTPNLRTRDVRKGDVIFIPHELSRRTDPMTRSYARRYGKTAAPVKQAAPKTAPPESSDYPEDGTPPTPYGPRTYPD
jgi:hypothetical protein